MLNARYKMGSNYPSSEEYQEIAKILHALMRRTAHGLAQRDACRIIFALCMPYLVPWHGCGSIQLRPCAPYMRTCIYLKEAPPEDDAERGERGACSILGKGVGIELLHPKTFAGAGRNDALARRKSGKKLT